MQSWKEGEQEKQTIFGGVVLCFGLAVVWEEAAVVGEREKNKRRVCVCVYITFVIVREDSAHFV
jgi:hypothetical protein